MSIEAIAALAPAAVTDLGASGGAAPMGNFGAWFSQQIDGVNNALTIADNDMRSLASGRIDNLHTVMIHLEEAKLTFQLFAQVRNHLLEAYQEVMRTQV
jgi:flagellar hook-basal body complex protein FliE